VSVLSPSFHPLWSTQLRLVASKRSQTDHSTVLLSFAESKRFKNVSILGVLELFFSLGEQEIGVGREVDGSRLASLFMLCQK